MKSSEISSPATILLTATVRVRPDMHETIRTSTSLRLADYRKAFTSWLSNPVVKRIVFVENSGYDLSEFKQMSCSHPDKSVEFFSFLCPDFPVERGKGYGEMLCLQHALQYSNLLKQTQFFIKSSGRYYLRNVHQLLIFMDQFPEFQIVCNLTKNLTWADSRAFGGSVDFLERYLLPLKDTLDDFQGIYFEHILARAAHGLLACGGAWTMLPVVPEIEGVHATNNIRYSLNPFILTAKKIIHQIRMRLLAGRI